MELDLVRGYELPFDSEGSETQKLTSGSSQLANGDSNMSTTLNGVNQANERNMRYDNNPGYVSDSGSRSGAGVSCFMFNMMFSFTSAMALL